MTTTGLQDASPATAPGPPLRMDQVVVRFRRTGPAGGPGWLTAVDGVTLELAPGELLGVVGESGSGKSTLARAALGLERVEPGGRVDLFGQPVGVLGSRAAGRLRARVGVVWQDPYSSLDPRMRIADIVVEPLRGTPSWRSRRRRRELAAEQLTQVDLPLSYLERHPHQLSGGERQRVGIARARIVDPELLVCDEPTSALDVTTRAYVMDLLLAAVAGRHTAMLLISHDISVVRALATTTAVMYRGVLVETGPVDEVLAAPAHPYTQALVSAVLDPDPRRERARAAIVLRGEASTTVARPAGCRFAERCWVHEELTPAEQRQCLTVTPVLLPVGSRHTTACHFPPQPKGSPP